MAERLMPDVAESLLDLDVEKQMRDNGKSLEIFAVGKPGVGKSSLVNDLLGPKAIKKAEVASGPRRGTMRKREYDIPLEGGISVIVYDTPGMYDAAADSDALDEDTIRLIGRVCDRSTNAILLVCMKMHDRLTEIDLRILARLHQKYGIQLWRSTIIALTHADDSKDLRNEFSRKLQEYREYLHELFTLPNDRAKQECCIGMTDDEYKNLEIPIMPTSVLENLPKMKVVGQENYFNHFLFECCKQERGTALVNIHSERMSALPQGIYTMMKEKLEEWTQDFSPEKKKRYQFFYHATGLSVGHMIYLFIRYRAAYSAVKSQRFVSNQP